MNVRPMVEELETRAVPATRLWILTGQSNMAFLNEKKTFVPAIQAAYPTDTHIFVKLASSGQMLSRWVEDYTEPPGVANIRNSGDLYRQLMAKVDKAIKNKTIDSVAFFLMQGEADGNPARSRGNWTVYEQNLQKLVGQVRTKFADPELPVVLGRLSDWSNKPAWNTVKAAQMAVADADPFINWVNTDDLNRDVHYTAKGYDEFGRRLAASGIALVNQAEE